MQSICLAPRAFRRAGLPPTEYAPHRLVGEAVGTSKPPPGSLEEAFAQWREKDATDDPEELRKPDEELDAFKQAMNANHAAKGERLLFP